MITMMRPTPQAPDLTEHEGGDGDRGKGDRGNRGTERVRSVRGRIGALFVYAAAAFAGLVMAMIALFNLHIIVGLEQGYAATPEQVMEFSPVLAVLDVLILVGAPIAAMAATWWVRRRLATPSTA